jgi:valyl-tRNA synthetase
MLRFALQPTGNESLVERWILYKLNAAAKEINQYLNDRNFMMATTSAYNFWLYELCDVYIVLSFIFAFRAHEFDGIPHRKR